MRVDVVKAATSQPACIMCTKPHAHARLLPRGKGDSEIEIVLASERFWVFGSLVLWRMTSWEMERLGVKKGSVVNYRDDWAAMGLKCRRSLTRGNVPKGNGRN